MSEYLQNIVNLKDAKFEVLFSGGNRSAKYFNTAGSAQVPEALASGIDHLRSHFEQEGPFGRTTNELRESILEQARAAVATYFAAPGTSVAITCNATEAMIALLTAMDDRRFERIVLGPDEHPSTLFPVTAFARRAKLEFLKEPLSRDHTSENTLLIISSTSYKTGKNISDETVAELARRNIPVLFDVTQSIGLCDLPARLLQLPNCVGVYGSCHKWLHCPQGTGFLVMKDAYADLFPRAMGGWRQISEITDVFTCASDARRFEGGTVDFAPIASMIPMFDLIRQEAFLSQLIENRRSKTALFLDTLGSHENCRVVSDNPGFVVLGGTAERPWQGPALADDVFEKTGYDIKPFSAAENPHGAVRLSFSPFNDKADMAPLAETINRFLGS